MATRNIYGVVELNRLEDLKREVSLLLGDTTISLVGPSGVGKTKFVEDMIKDPSFGIDKLVILRLQGLTSEDFRIPVVNTVEIDKDGVKKEEKQVDFATIGIFKEIDDNPDKKYLLFFDEILRADRSVAPLLFSILEGKMLDGIRRKNVMIMAAFNYGGDYDSNIDLNDDALRRRQTFIQYNPSKDDFVNFIEENEYHPIIREVAEYVGLDTIIDHETTKELMQPTTFGSWDLLNKRWNKMSALYPGFDYGEAKRDIETRGSMYFTDRTITNLLDKLILIEELNTVDIQKEIIDKNGLDDSVIVYKKDGKVYDKTDKKKQIQIKVLNFVRRESMMDDDYLLKNIAKLLKVFSDEKTLIVSLIKQIQNDIKRTYGDKGKPTKISAEKEKKIFLGTVKIIKEVAENDPQAKELWNSFQDLYTFMTRSAQNATL
ncbi:MAG: AAA family ATPase [Cetobacterium sp.]|uniref:AAA family ATPase n=1 Tax=Cetobacterium sp. TaxID=2071632 RepID=UPI003F2D315B